MLFGSDGEMRRNGSFAGSSLLADDGDGFHAWAVVALHVCDHRCKHFNGQAVCERRRREPQRSLRSKRRVGVSDSARCRCGLSRIRRSDRSTQRQEPNWPRRVGPERAAVFGLRASVELTSRWPTRARLRTSERDPAPVLAIWRRFRAYHALHFLRTRTCYSSCESFHLQSRMASWFVQLLYVRCYPHPARHRKGSDLNSKTLVANFKGK